MKNLAVIPARSQSKGLRDKNIQLLCGKPLMAYSIAAALSSGVFDTIHVSTDSERYGQIARDWGAEVPFLRSMETSSDTASSWDVVLEVLENYAHQGKTFDTVSLLQTTSPLRTAEDIVRAYRLMEERRAEAVVSVCEAEHSPLWCGTLPEDGCLDGFILPKAKRPRQALEQYYRLNGAVYIISVPALQSQRDLAYGPDCYAYIMPKERSIDIDEMMDLRIAEVLMQSQD